LGGIIHVWLFWYCEFLYGEYSSKIIQFIVTEITFLDSLDHYTPIIETWQNICKYAFSPRGHLWHIHCEYWFHANLSNKKKKYIYKRKSDCFWFDESYRCYMTSLWGCTISFKKISVFAMYVSQMSTGIVVIPVWSFPHSWLTTGFVTRMPHVEQELSFYIMFGRSLFVLLSLFFWQLKYIYKRKSDCFWFDESYRCYMTSLWGCTISFKKMSEWTHCT
jgi:hypothetical protein